MADYAFGEVTRLLYDAIWNEFCDWGVELAKVRLADESLPDADREATWWALVEALDTYLRLLHPVMPFVTEALWAAIPHRATDPGLLIVARWPGRGSATRGRGRGRALIDLVRDLRNARATAKLPAGGRGWSGVHVPTELGRTFEALRPAIERLARARPLGPGLTPEALAAVRAPGGLTVVAAAGDIEARSGRARPTPDGQRPRAGPAGTELAEAEGWLAAARERLANEAFMAKAPPGGRRGRPRPRSRARRAGRAAARRPGRLTARRVSGPRDHLVRRDHRQVVGRVARLGHDPAVDGAQAAAEHVVDPVRAARAPPGSPGWIPTALKASSNASRVPQLRRLDRPR